MIKDSDNTLLVKTICDQSPVGAIVVEKKTNKILYINKSALDICSISPEMLNSPNSILLNFKHEIAEDHVNPKSFANNSSVQIKLNNGKIISSTIKNIEWEGKDAIIEYITDVTDRVEMYQQLKRKEKSLHTALYINNLGSWDYDILNNRIIYDKEYAEILGVPRIQDNADTAWKTLNYFKKEYYPAYEKMLENILSGKKEVDSLELELNRAENNKNIWYKTTYAITERDENGKPICAIGINTDITAQKIIEERYNNEYLYHKSLVDATIFTLLFNVSNKEILKIDTPANTPAIPSAFTIDDFIDNYCNNFVAEDKDKEILSKLFDINNLTDCFYKGETKLSYEYKFRQQNGNICWVMTSLHLLNNRNGNIVAFAFTKNTNTEKIKTLISQNIINNEIDFSGYIDLQTNTFNLTFTNTNYEDYMKKFDGLSSEQLLNLMLTDIQTNKASYNLSDLNLQFIQKQLKEKNNYSFIYTTIDKHYNKKIKKLYFKYPENYEKIIITLQSDVTELFKEQEKHQKLLQEALDEAKKANSAKSDFLAQISHDLRTPMNVIINMADTALEENDITEMKTSLTKIHTTSKFLLGLINDVLDMSKIEIGHINLKPELYMYSEFNKTLEVIIKPLCVQKNIKFISTTTDAHLYVIKTDITRFNQIFFNLLTNAVKYTPSGGQISLTCTNQVINGNLIEFDAIVEDNGIGISKEFQKILFEPFTREANSLSTSTDGIGLGLAIVKKLVSLMGYTISVESELGKGSKFTVHICSEYIDEPTNKLPESKETTSISKLYNINVLLVEDHDLNAEVATKLLSRYDINVDRAENGQIAVEKFEKSPVNYYDIILMDIRMPIMNGLEATKAIRALNKYDAKTVPIIAMTANAFETDTKQSLEAGMNEHLSKPIEPKLMFKTMLKYIK